MQLLNTFNLEIKKSKFIAYYYKIQDLNDINTILDKLKKDNKKARHMSYAYKYGNTARKSDDKEPSGTAGLPIFNIIEKNNLQNVIIVVIRYFGGVKLGAGGLIRAYSAAAREVIKIN